MRRRDFIKVVAGSAVVGPLVARAQQRAFPVVGLLSARSPAVDTPLIAVIRQGLNETGFVEGQNIALDYRWADGQYERLAGLAADFVRQQVAVIVTMGGEVSAVAAKAATATIPIVFVTGGDPLRSGLVTSLQRPGGNITGASTLVVETEAKRLGLLRELRPHATTVAVLMNPGNISFAETQVSDIQTAAHALAERAIGYDDTWEEEVLNPVTGELRTVKMRRHYPADVGAIKFHLTNRAKDRWREQQNIEVETKRETSQEILDRIYARLAKMREQGYLTSINVPALPAPEDDSDVED